VAAAVLLDVSDFRTVTPTRAVDAANNTRADLAPIDVVAFLNDPEVVTTSTGKRYAQSGVLRVRRPASGDLDLQNGDEITLPEGTFGIVGAPQRKRRHSLTGADFGWERFTIRKGG
jgi:hypothetical protein